jgi:hypothetical protein
MDIVGIVNISMVKCLWFMDVYGRHAVDGCEILHQLVTIR